MKTCLKCGIEKEFSEFAWKNQIKGTLNSWCRACHKEYKDAHYQRNRVNLIAKAMERAKVWKENQYRWIWEYFKSNPCVDCGESDPVVLEFDHVRGTKKAAISAIIGDSFKSLVEEIEKCEVRCANCHRRKTAKTLGYYKYLSL
jgi:5-methylcytosine-specific restriction endonuclease McrA